MPRSASETIVETRPGGSSGADVIEFPIRPGYVGQDSIDDVVLALATADDLAAGMSHLVAWLQQRAGVSRVEWWATGNDGVTELLAAAGAPHPQRYNVRLGPAGVLVLHGGHLEPKVNSELSSLTPILRRRATEERLTKAAMQLARRNEALEDFAALVAHELKTPLHAALLADDPSGRVEQALELVDALLQAAQDEPAERTFAAPIAVLDQAVEDLAPEISITADVATPLPLPAGALRVILWNLLSNAVAAGARHVHVAAERSCGSFHLLVDDDGSGLVDTDRYASGSGLGLALSRRIARRFGGRLQLAAHPSGGTRATLEFTKGSEWSAFWSSTITPCSEPECAADSNESPGSSIASSRTSTSNGRISVPLSTVVLMRPPYSGVTNEQW
jgi:signal transduction histidine kinase